MTRNPVLWLLPCSGLCAHVAAQLARAQPAAATPQNDPGNAPPSAAGPTPVAAPSSAPPAAPSGLEPPKLIAESPAQYPEEARRLRLEATVLLGLSIDTSGQVTDAQVLEPAGHGFDEAAREAALRLRFEPAKRNGTPIPAKIRLPCPFKLAPEPPELVLDLPVPQPIAAAASDSKVTEVTVRGKLTEVQRLQQSAEAVNVIDTRKAKEATADMGEVLARTQGVAVRRDGGLGSYARSSLNGLYDEQVRFFLDGLPLEIVGYPSGITNVPVNLVEHAEVYRGVVPIRFGADALGGAVNLVTDTSYQDRLAASYQIGSFGTHRITLDSRYRHDPTGFVVGASGYIDLAKNNYKVDVDIPDARGRPAPATVSRFHDAYAAYGATVETGIVDQPWAKRLLLRGNFSTYDKELQNNVVMSVLYGEVTYGESVAGGTARYEVEPRDDVNVEVVGSYSLRTIDYLDVSKWIYNWRGERVGERPVPGEIESRPHDQTYWEHTTFGRGIASWKIAPQHQVRASFTPRFSTRTGDERIQADPNSRDPLTARRDNEKEEMLRRLAQTHCVHPRSLLISRSLAFFGALGVLWRLNSALLEHLLLVAVALRSPSALLAFAS